MDRIVLVTKPTRLDELILKHHTHGAAKFALEQGDQPVEPYEREHRAYEAALEIIRSQLPNDIPVSSVQREQLPNFLFRDKDLIVVCGPDGLFVNLAKYVDDQPIIAVNPDPRTVAGELMIFSPQQVGELISLVQAGTHHLEALPFAKATIDGEKIVWAVNDIFIGRKDHVSARYQVSFGAQKEPQSSSGIIVSTGVGCTGWMRSIATMVSGLTREGQLHKLSILPQATDTELVFAVREPFPSPSTKAGLVTGRIVPGKPLIVSSEMPEGGFIFSDGVVEKAVEWNAGSTVVVTVGDRFVQRVVP